MNMTTFRVAIAALLFFSGSAMAQNRLVAVTSGNTLYEINPSTGAGTNIGTVSSNAGTTGGLAFDCASQTLWVSSTGNDNLYTLNLGTGTATLVGNYGNSAIVMHGLEFDNSTGTIYGGSDGTLYSINPTTGFATPIGPSGTTSFFNLGYHRRLDTLFGTSSNTDSIYTINRATGQATLLSVLGSGISNPQALAYHKDNGGLYLIDTGTDGLYLIDTDTGVAHRVGDIPTNNILGLAYVSSDCAEPTVPNGAGYMTPYNIIAGNNSIITVRALPVAGANPSTGLFANANLQSIGGGASVLMNAGPNNTFTLQVTPPANLTAGIYTFPITITDAQGRSGSAEVALRVRGGPPAGFVAEVEPNDSKATATSAAISPGEGVFGFTTGTSTTVPGDTSADYYVIKTPAAAPGIYRHRMVINTIGTAGHTGTIRGLTQTTGNINPGTDATLQTSSTTSTPPRFNQWYGFGKREEVSYRVTGSTTTSSDYTSTLETQAVTPIELTTALQPGSITISRANGVTAAMDYLIYDSTFTAMGDFVYEGTTSLTRTFTPGTYYIGVSNVNTADNRPTPVDSTARGSSVLDNPNAVINSSTTLVAAMGLRFVDSTGNAIEIGTPKTEPFQVIWVKITVTGGATAGCNPADIACDTGDPLVSNPGCTNSTTGPNEGDYNAFFAANGFFFQAGQSAGGVGGFCDIACDNGDPLATNPGCTNNGVNEGDYNCFFNNLFLPCV
ncbi:MAG: hypothetical protein IBJ18_01775 [Phycisphaerales bacterium]|nr:hypothetical protein [Phycisphaerales bacterium]